MPHHPNEHPRQPRGKADCGHECRMKHRITICQHTQLAPRNQGSGAGYAQRSTKHPTMSPHQAHPSPTSIRRRARDRRSNAPGSLSLHQPPHASPVAEVDAALSLLQCALIIIRRSSQVMPGKYPERAFSCAWSTIMPQRTATGATSPGGQPWWRGAEMAKIEKSDLWVEKSPITPTSGLRRLICTKPDREHPGVGCPKRLGRVWLAGAAPHWHVDPRCSVREAKAVWRLPPPRVLFLETLATVQRFSPLDQKTGSSIFLSCSTPANSMT
ncbi:hypothetical protein B0T11DRAFT_136289 [Plectosphaerella cucumerina]|uniref:Uncharacterized protein n=1 Tax=Plectosphaerella cucumerina TaxID=40658 RepID=A0A8K0TCK4_9PEZI|nr:hypothetical protein B0T11DRAFT_136289 [Plectosphaerella cucumerina]